MNAVREAIRDGIQRLEDNLKQGPTIDPELLTSHHFAPGVYARALIIPKGSELTGKIHKTEHLNIVAAGKIRVVSEEGAREVTAPDIFVSMPGIKRAGHALENTVWITIHVTDETDLEKIEDEVIARDYSEIEGLLT